MESIINIRKKAYFHCNTTIDNISIQWCMKSLVKSYIYAIHMKNPTTYCESMYYVIVLKLKYSVYQ